MNLSLACANETQARDAELSWCSRAYEELRKRAAEEKDKQMSSKKLPASYPGRRCSERELILSDALPEGGPIGVTIQVFI
jgi:hypothetical protein